METLTLSTEEVATLIDGDRLALVLKVAEECDVQLVWDKSKLGVTEESRLRCEQSES